MTEVGYCLGSVHYDCPVCGKSYPHKLGLYVDKHFAKFTIRIWICKDCVRTILTKIDDQKLIVVSEKNDDQKDTH